MHTLSVTPTTRLGEPALHLQSTSGSEATVLLYGGHVVSFRPAQGPELLYLSPTATTANRSAVRGGVPVIFPQFDRRGPLATVPRHGFARARPFEHVEGPQDAVRLRLRDDDDSRRTFPYAFELTLQLSLTADALTLDMEVLNRDEHPWAFTGALHTYLQVADVETALVVGLQGHLYEDKVRDGATATGTTDPLQIRGEVDRIYAAVQAIELQCPDRHVRIEQHGFTDAVIWNPGPTLAAGLADLPDDGYREMLCIEAANALSPVELPAGEQFHGQQRITLHRP